MNIELWLNDLGLSEYINVFKEESIDIEVLPELTSDDLKEIGVNKLGHRKIILKAIKIRNRKLSENIKINLIKEVAKIKKLPHSITFEKAKINSKEVGKNDVFFAIKGKKNDGNKFVL